MEWNRVEISKQTLDRAVSLYFNEHLSIKDVAVRLGLGRERLQREFKAHGIRKTPTQQHRRSVLSRKDTGVGVQFDTLASWSPESAWVWGLWFGDGWVTQANATPVIGWSGDRQSIEAVRAITTNRDHAISMLGKSARLTFGSRLLSEYVSSEFGYSPGRKSRIIRFPAVPASVLSHFVRGLWDSDGCWTVNRAGGYRYLYGAYASMSREFVSDLEQVLHLNCGVRRRTIEMQHKGCSAVRYASADCATIGNWLYAGSSATMRTERKYLKWIAEQKNPQQGE